MEDVEATVSEVGLLRLLGAGAQDRVLVKLLLRAHLRPVLAAQVVAQRRDHARPARPGERVEYSEIEKFYLPARAI